jgi:hypothetical protein
MSWEKNLSRCQVPLYPLLSHRPAWERTQGFSIEVRRLSAWTMTHSLVIVDVSECIMYGINTSHQCWDSNLSRPIPKLVAIQINQKHTSDQWDTFRRTEISCAVIFQSWHRLIWPACTFSFLRTTSVHRSVKIYHYSLFRVFLRRSRLLRFGIIKGAKIHGAIWVSKMCSNGSPILSFWCNSIFTWKVCTNPAVSMMS